MAEGHRERMRERVRNFGLASLAPHEILEFLLFPLIPRKETNRLAHRLLRQFGDLNGVFTATEGELLSAEGMTPYAALYLSVYRGAVSAAEVDNRRRVLCFDNVNSVFRYFQSVFRGVKEEQVVLLALDGARTLIRQTTLARGSADTVEIDLQSVARFALDNRAKSVILCHNHLYGSVEPSDADLRSTWNLETFLRSMNIRLYDSMILAGDEIFSFRLAGALGGDGRGQDKLKLHNAGYFYQKFEELYESILKTMIDTGDNYYYEEQETL